MAAQREAWFARDAAYDAKARAKQQEQRRLAEAARRRQAADDVSAAEEAKHAALVEARLARLGLAKGASAGAAGEETAPDAAVNAAGQVLGDASALIDESLRSPGAARSPTAKQQQEEGAKPVRKITAAEIEAREELEFRPLERPAALVSDAELERGLANAAEGVGDLGHATMFRTLHELWREVRTAESPRDTSGKELVDTAAEDARMRRLVVARFVRYRESWPEADDEEVVYEPHKAGWQRGAEGQGNQGRRPRPSTAPAGARGPI